MSRSNRVLSFRRGKAADSPAVSPCPRAVRRSHDTGGPSPARSVPAVLSLICLLSASGCLSAPRETVELAEIVDAQLVAIQQSHEQIVQKYYEKLRQDVDAFLQERWIPQFLSNVIEGTGEQSGRFRKDLDTAYKLSTVDWERVVKIEGIEDDDLRQAIQDALRTLAEKERATLGVVLLDFSKAVQEQINRRRQSLIAPINEQEALVLKELRATYADMYRGNAAVKAHLASVADVVQQRDAVLNKLDLLDTQREIVDTAITLSDGAAKALVVAEKAETSIDNFLQKMKEARDAIQFLSDRGAD